MNDLENFLHWMDNRYTPAFEKLMVEKVWPEANDNIPKYSPSLKTPEDFQNG